jgi:hypothetical protein
MTVSPWANLLAIALQLRHAHLVVGAHAQLRLLHLGVQLGLHLRLRPLHRCLHGPQLALRLCLRGPQLALRLRI